MSLSQIAIGGLVVGSIYAAIALGFSLVYRVTGAINLSQGGFALVAAMIGYTFGVAWGWPLVVAIPAAVIATVIIGVCARGASRSCPALTRLSNANVLMLTAGILTMIEGFSLAVWGSQPYAMPPFSGEQPLAFGAILIPTQAFWVFGATALCIVALWFLIARTKLGKASSRLRRKSFRREPDGHRRAADDAAELWPGDADRGDLGRDRRADHLAAIRHRPPVHDFRIRCGRDRRHRLVSRRGDRRAVSRARDAALDRLHLLAVFERDLACSFCWWC